MKGMKAMSDYANALMEVAKKNDCVDQVTTEFDNLHDIVFSHPKWLNVMDSPMYQMKDKDDKIDKLNLSPTLSACLKTMIRKNHMSLFFDVYHDWIRLIRAQQKIAHINVYSAKKLTDKQESMLLKRLKPRFEGMTIDLHLRVDPELIGGVKIIYQGVSLDRSIARELDELFTTL